MRKSSPMYEWMFSWGIKENISQRSFYITHRPDKDFTTMQIHIFFTQPLTPLIATVNSTTTVTFQTALKNQNHNKWNHNCNLTTTHSNNKCNHNCNSNITHNISNRSFTHTHYLYNNQEQQDNSLITKSFAKKIIVPKYDQSSNDKTLKWLDQLQAIIKNPGKQLTQIIMFMFLQASTMNIPLTSLTTRKLTQTSCT